MLNYTTEATHMVEFWKQRYTVDQSMVIFLIVFIYDKKYVEMRHILDEITTIGIFNCVYISILLLYIYTQISQIRNLRTPCFCSDYVWCATFVRIFKTDDQSINLFRVVLTYSSIIATK